MHPTVEADVEDTDLPGLDTDLPGLDTDLALDEFTAPVLTKSTLELSLLNNTIEPSRNGNFSKNLKSEKKVLTFFFPGQVQI